MKDTLTTEENKDRPQTQTGGKRDEATSDRVAEAGSLDQAGEGVSRNVADVSNSFSSAAVSIDAFSKGEGDALDVAMNVKGAVDKLRGLSGRISESLMLPIMTKLSAIKGQAILPAAKQMDPVMGVDVHVVTIPPAVPTPLPHPYIGILFRAKDWVSCLVNTYKPLIKETTVNLVSTSFGEGAAASVSKHSEALMGMAMGFANLIASVKFGGFVPRAITGTSTRNFPHIPFGAGWHPSFAVPVKKNHGKVFLGSLFVAADGDPMAGFGHLHYDCWDMGVPDLLKGQRNAVKKSPDPSGPQAELYVPSGMLLPIPWGRPVLVNSIPTPINPLSLGDRLFKAGLSKLRRSREEARRREELENRKGIPCAAKSPLTDSGPPSIVGGRRENGKKMKQVKPVPPFKRNPKHSKTEYERQLKKQETAINNMTVKDWMKNRENFRNRDKKKYDTFAAQKRKEYREQELNRRIEKNMQPPKNMTPEQANKEAVKSMKGQAALHNPDGIAGGRAEQISGMGDSRVNSSIGSQWQHGRADAIENQIKQQYGIPPKTVDDIPATDMMNVSLF